MNLKLKEKKEVRLKIKHLSNVSFGRFFSQGKEIAPFKKFHEFITKSMEAVDEWRFLNFWTNNYKKQPSFHFVIASQAEL